MDLYEYQGKQLFARFGIPVSDGRVALTPDEARAAAAELGGPVVVKAQVLDRRPRQGRRHQARDDAGGGRASARARSSGSTSAATSCARSGSSTRPTSSASTTSRSRSTAGRSAPLFMLTTSGGVDIEEVAENDPDAIARLHLDPLAGWHPWVARELCFRAGIPAAERKQVMAIIEAAYRAFREADAMLVEINPLIVTPDGEVRALDSKVTIDDNALIRHPDIAAMRDVAAADPQEQMAREKGLTYVKLDGEVGILGNGAGLVMSTLDVVAQAGGRAGQLPRRRRRRAGAGDRRRARGHPLRPEGARDPLQHLRRHHALRRGRARASWTRSTGATSACRSSSASTARTTRRAASCWPTPTRPASYVARTMLDAAAPRRRAGREGRLMAILVDLRDAPRRAGHHRPRGLVPRDAQPRLRHRRSSPA